MLNQHMANIHQAKTHLSQLVQYAERGDEVIICRAGQPAVKLVPVEKPKPKKRKLGLLKGQVKIAKDFDEWPEWFLEYFR